MKKLFSSGAALLALMAALPAVANPVPWKLNMTQGVTSTAATAYEMHMLMLWICIFIGIIVFGVMFFAMFRFRKSQGAVADTTFVHSNRIEAIWTTVPVLILIGMAYPATQKLMFMFVQCVGKSCVSPRSSR